jgi:hypothetical protein
LEASIELPQLEEQWDNHFSEENKKRNLAEGGSRWCAGKHFNAQPNKVDMLILPRGREFMDKWGDCIESHDSSNPEYRLKLGILIASTIRDEIEDKHKVTDNFDHLITPQCNELGRHEVYEKILEDFAFPLNADVKDLVQIDIARGQTEEERSDR